MRTRIGFVVTFLTTPCYSRGPAPARSPDLLGRINHNDIFNQLHTQLVRCLKLIQNPVVHIPWVTATLTRTEVRIHGLDDDQWPGNGELLSDTWKDVKAVFENDINWLRISRWILAHHS